MAENIVQAKVTIKGTRPMFFHHFGRDSIPLDDRREKTGKAGNDPEEWRRTVLVNKDGQLYIEPTYAFSTIIAGSKFTKKGRGSIQTDVQATLQVLDNRILINRWFPGFPNGKEFDPATADVPPEDQEQPLYLDVRAVINPSTRARNVRYRVAASPGWECSFTVVWDKTIVQPGHIQAALIDAGKLVGIGNGRKIGMGRFEVISFEMLN